MLASAALLALGAGITATTAQAQQASTMTFFLTSVGAGKGADLGGLEGADRYCQQLAQGAGAGGKTWRAYLSTQASGGTQAVNARDRIGAGPWKNAKGDTIAQNVDDLHSANNKISKQTALTEKGEMVNGRTDTPNRHDVLTGSQPDGRAFTAGEDRTCG
ncbi:MAG: lectin, partial [Xanthobacteraceae bacterium]